MSIAESPVTTTPGFTLAGQAGAAGETTLLYTVTTVAPERIETVTFSLDYGGSEPAFDVFAVQLRDAAGNVLYEQATPTLTATDMSSLVVRLVWSRLGNDSAQEAFYVHDDAVSGFSLGWANLRLPDLVLASQSTVALRSWTNYDGEHGTLSVADCTVTVTRNAGAVSTTTLADVFPLLTPTDEG